MAPVTVSAPVVLKVRLTEEPASPLREKLPNWMGPELPVPSANWVPCVATTSPRVIASLPASIWLVSETVKAPKVIF